MSQQHLHIFNCSQYVSTDLVSQTCQPGLLGLHVEFHHLLRVLLHSLRQVRCGYFSLNWRVIYAVRNTTPARMLQITWRYYFIMGIQCTSQLMICLHNIKSLQGLLSAVLCPNKAVRWQCACVWVLCLKTVNDVPLICVCWGGVMMGGGGGVRCVCWGEAEKECSKLTQNNTSNVLLLLDKHCIHKRRWNQENDVCNHR